MGKRLLAAVAALAACGGEVIDTTGGSTSGAGGAFESTSAGTTTSASAGGSTPCVVQPEDLDAGFQEPTCADLAVMTVTSPVVKGPDGTSKLAPGETGTIDVSLDEIAGKGFSYYPAVTFTSDVAGITVESGAQFFAILPCTSVDAPGSITVSSDVPKGTMAHIVARVAMLNHDCPDAPSISIPIEIQ
ncbi:Hypothetical protein A7982_07075 [Minicystis rosea]|nr:Hypothetical protein A7982_07075 [Minicystis rosea]